MIIAVRILPILKIPKELLVWVVTIAVIRIAGYIIGFIKYRSFSSLHTISNKLTGVLLFLSPFMYMVMGISIMGVILCAAATISSSEELWITIKAKKLQRDIKGI